MPTKVIRYTCDYGCGKNLATHKSIAKHESSCWHSEAVKACTTCVYQHLINNNGTYHRLCDNTEGSFLVAAQYAELRYGNNIKPITNCPHHTTPEQLDKQKN